MSKGLLITETKSIKKGFRKRTFKPSLKFGPVTLVMITIMMICLASLLFLTQILQSSTKGYEISDLQDKIKTLKEDNELLEIKAAELRSLENIENAANEMNMVKVDDIVYVHKSGSDVAVNR